MTEALSAPLSPAVVEALEGALLSLPQSEIRYVHTFSPGIYVREAHVKAGMTGVGHEHKQETVNILLKGKIRLADQNGTAITLVAPLVFTSAPGVRKIALFEEDTIFLNVLPNPDNETDLAKLEERYVVKSDTFLQHRAEAQAINEGKL